MIIKILVSLLPMFLFLLLLVFLDSYKLIAVKKIVKAVVAGALIAGIVYFVNKYLIKANFVTYENFSRYIAPLTEEFFKILVPIYLVKKNKVGFSIDGAIMGFAVGSGFAMLENVFYLVSITENNLFFWIVRGFGTAIMHGGNTAIFTMLLLYLINKLKYENYMFALVPLAFVYVIHSFFNHFFLPPFYNVFLQVFILPLIMIKVFYINEKNIKKWLHKGFDTDVNLLANLKSGKFGNTDSGKYLGNFKSSFKPEIVFDLYCYLRVFLELSIRSKGVLMMKDAGFEIEIEDEISQKFKELEYLEKEIGYSAVLTLNPLLNLSKKELWQIYFLKNQ